MRKKYNQQFIFLLFLFIGVHSFAQKSAIDSLKRVLSVAKIDTSKVNTYNYLADQFKESNPDSTAFYAQKAMQLSQKIEYNFGLANSLMNSGNANIIRSNYGQALKDFNKAQSVYKKLLETNSEIDKKKIKNGLARAYASAGVVFSVENNYPKALENYQSALEIYQEIGQKNNVSKAYNNIGIVYKSQNNNPKSLEYFKKALKIQEKIGEQTAAVTLMNIGVIYFENDNNPEAIKYYNQAKKRFEKLDNKRGFALLNNYFGDYYTKLKDIG